MLETYNEVRNKDRNYGLTTEVLFMPAIYPSTALKNQQREIKEIADKEVVYITENGRGKYAFMSEEVFQREIENAVEDALYEERLIQALRQSREDYAAGRYYTSREEMLAVVAKKRDANAQG